MQEQLLTFRCLKGHLAVASPQTTGDFYRCAVERCPYEVDWKTHKDNLHERPSCGCTLWRPCRRHKSIWEVIPLNMCENCIGTGKSFLGMRCEYCNGLGLV